MSSEYHQNIIEHQSKSHENSMKKAFWYNFDVIRWLFFCLQQWFETVSFELQNERQESDRERALFDRWKNISQFLDSSCQKIDLFYCCSCNFFGFKYMGRPRETLRESFERDLRGLVGNEEIVLVGIWDWDWQSTKERNKIEEFFFFFLEVAI